MVRPRAEDVVAQCAAAAVGDPGGIVEQGRKIGFAALDIRRRVSSLLKTDAALVEPVTYIVQVHVDAAVMQHQEIPGCVDALHRILVVIVGVQEPGVFGFDKVSRGLLGPELERPRVSNSLVSTRSKGNGALETRNPDSDQRIADARRPSATAACHCPAGASCGRSDG